jgi:hypothetical protein
MEGKRKSESLFLPWLRAGLERPGKTRTGLAQALGINQTQVWKLLSGERNLKADEAVVAARYLEKAWPRIPGIVRAKGSEPGFPLTHHEIGVGVPIDRDWTKQFIPDPQFSHLPHYAAKVTTRDVDIKIPVGAYAIYVMYWDARTKIEDGDMVLAELGNKVVVTPLIRVIRRSKRGFVLTCASSDHRINLDGAIALNRKLNEPTTGREFKLIGLVTYWLARLDS